MSSLLSSRKSRIVLAALAAGGAAGLLAWIFAKDSKNGASLAKDEIMKERSVHNADEPKAEDIVAIQAALRTAAAKKKMSNRLPPVNKSSRADGIQEAYEEDVDDEPSVDEVKKAKNVAQRLRLMQKWVPLPTMQKKRAGGSVCLSADNTKLFVVGGSHMRKVWDTVEAYDITLGSWSTLKPAMQVKRSGAGVCVSPNGRYLYVIGGHNSKWKSLLSAERYDFRNEKWEDLPPLSVDRAQPGVCMSPDGRKIYVLGGYSSKMSKWLNSVERLNVWNNKWEKITPMMGTRAGAGAFISSDGKTLYAVGGVGDQNKLRTNTMESYTIGDKEWKQEPPMMLVRGDAAFCMSSDRKRIYALGADGSKNTSVECFDFDSQKWTQLAPMQRGRSSFGAAASNRTLFAVGGQGGKKAENTVEHLRIDCMNMV